MTKRTRVNRCKLDKHHLRAQSELSMNQRKEVQAMIKIGLTLCATSIIIIAISDPNLLHEIWNWVLTYKGPGQ